MIPASSKKKKARTVGVHDPDEHLRDHFAAMAPTDIPDWFDAYPRVPAVLPPSHDHLYERERFAVQAVVVEGRELDESYFTADRLAVVKGSIETLRTYRRTRDAGIRQNKIACYFAWRWFYAEQMLATRKGAK